MLRRTRTGMIVWGALLVIGGGALALALLAGSEYDRGMAFLGVILFIGGALLLGFGIANAIRVSKHNNSILAEGKTYVGKCISCGNPINTTIRDFRPHGRFPEGYMICPVCKKPVSMNAFNVYDASGHLIQSGMQPNIYAAAGYPGQQVQNQYRVPNQYQNQFQNQNQYQNQGQYHNGQQ